MIQFAILSGKQAGSAAAARRFPYRIGRAQDCDLNLDEPGVWDQHVTVDFEPGSGFIISTLGEALMTINGENVGNNARLRSGDIIAIGGARLQFGLDETIQSSGRIRDMLVWAGITAVTLLQMGLIYWLIG